MADIKEATDDEKLGFFFDRVCMLAKQLGVHAYVMLAELGDNRSSSRYPDCEPDCPHPDECAVRIFRVMSEEFTDLANAIENGDTDRGEHRTATKEEA